MRLGIIANTGKPHIPDLLASLLEWLDQQRIPFVVAAETAVILNTIPRNTLPADSLGHEVDFVLSFGGDGTFLQTARAIAPSGTPIVGVNLGAFGYLAEVQLDAVKERILDLAGERFQINERMMLNAIVVTTGETFLGLNDVVVEKGDFPRTIRLVAEVDGEYLNTFAADGVIISTPTGSTGYSLSAGGPILEPQLNGLIINPICPHMLANRPLVVSDERVVSITSATEDGSIFLSVDGQRVAALRGKMRVEIQKSALKTRIVNFSDYSFYRLLRTKLDWGSRGDEA